MNLKDFKKYIEEAPTGAQFKFGISKPFSWRGSYDEVAFSILETPMTREDILANIELAYTETFYGYKGGEYTFNDYTPVNFEESPRDWTDGEYAARMIGRIENSEVFKSQEERLVKLAFSDYYRNLL